MCTRASCGNCGMCTEPDDDDEPEAAGCQWCGRTDCDSDCSQRLEAIDESAADDAYDREDCP